jgi:dihydroxyacetone synthase
MAPALELLERPIEYLPAKGVSTSSNGVVTTFDAKLESPEKHQRVMNVFRAFIADLCQQYGEGHAG